MTFASIPYDPEHDTSAFTSGEPSLDKWLAADAETEIKRGSARVWAWLDDAGRVVAYYSLSASKVKRDDIPTQLWRGGPVEIPAVLIGRRALHRSLRGRPGLTRTCARPNVVLRSSASVLPRFASRAGVAATA